MRLLYLTRTYTGHDARWLRALAGEGVRLGCLPLQTIDEMVFNREHPEVDLLDSPGLPVAAGTARLDDAVPLARQQIRAWSPDVIMAGPLTDAGYVAAHVAAEKTLLMSWAFDVMHEPRANAEAGTRLQCTLGAAQHLFTDSESVLLHCEKLARRTFQHACTLPWGLAAADTPEPCLGTREKWGDHANVVVFSPRGFSPLHRPEVVIESFAQAHVRNKQLRLWLAGSGAMQVQVERVTDAMGLRSVVRFLGQIDQAALAGCFAEADVYLSCADSDGTSISLLQALHAGLPCVVTDLPGNREWLESPGGWFAAPGQHRAFALGLGEAAELTAEVRAQIAGAHRSRVNQRADLATNLPRLLATLESIAGRAPVRPRQLLAV